MTSPIRMDPAICGFPGVQLGGYVASVVLGGRSGTATFHRPTPSGAGPELAPGRLLDADGRVLASASGEPVHHGTPRAVDLESARAMRPIRPDRPHPVPCCFACGAERPDGRGLGARFGVVAGGDVVAGEWVPPSTEADSRGVIGVGSVWSVLDCAGFWSLSLAPPPVDAVVTRRFTGTTLGVVRAGRPHIVTARPVRTDDGSPLVVCAALRTLDGQVLATASQLLAPASWGFPIAAIRDDERQLPETAADT